MLVQLLLSALGVGLTLAIHIGALVWLFRPGRATPTLLRATAVTLALLLAHLVEIIGYAALLRLAVALGLGSLRGELGSPGTDYFYLSAVTYTTVGFGDLTPSPGLRLLTAVEALNGIVLAGVTTSALLVLLSAALRERLGLPPDGQRPALR